MTPNPRTNQLYDVQKKALRLICKPYQRSKKTLSNAWVTQKTHVLPVPLLSTYFACNFAFSIKSCKCSSYISKYFWTICSNKNNRTRQPSFYNYNQPNHYLETSRNSLPPDLRSSSPSSFKAKLKHHFFWLNIVWLFPAMILLVSTPAMIISQWQYSYNTLYIFFTCSSYSFFTFFFWASAFIYPSCLCSS